MVLYFLPKMTFFIPDIKVNRGKFSDVCHESFFLSEKKKDKKKERERKPGSHFGQLITLAKDFVKII